MWLAEITLCCFLGVKALMVGQKEEPEKATGSRKRTEQRRSLSGSFAAEAVAAEKEKWSMRGLAAPCHPDNASLCTSDTAVPDP